MFFIIFVAHLVCVLENREIAILSGTDPIAVAGLLNSSGAPHRLKVSLFSSPYALYFEFMLLSTS